MKNTLLFLVFTAALVGQIIQPGQRSGGGGGTGCVPSGSSGQILSDDGSGACTSNSTASGILTWIGTPTGVNLASALTTPLTAGKGGTGIANTATLTLGSSNQNWATLGTGIVKNTTTTGAISDAVAADIVAVFSTCSGIQYLGADGSCHTALTGTVTSVATGCGASGGTITSTGTVLGIGVCVTIANESGTGTTANKLVQLTGAPSTAIITGTGTTTGIVGVCDSGCGTTGSAVILQSGLHVTTVDGFGSVAGHWAIQSTGTAGDTADSGVASTSAPPTGAVGIFLQTLGGLSTVVTNLMNTEAASGVCATCVTAAGTLTYTAIMTGGGSKASQTPAATATMDSSGNISTPGNVAAASFSTSGGPTITGTGIIGLGETTGQACAASADCLIADSGSHVLKLSNNNGTATPLLISSATGIQTWLTTPSGANLTSALTTPLTVAGGGTGLATLTAHALYVGNGTTAPSALAVGATDKPVVGVTAGDPVFSKLTLTNPATGSTLTVADGKTVVVNNGITFTGTDSTTQTFPTTSQTIPGMNQANLAGSSYTLNLTSTQGGQFLYGPQAPSVSDTDAICAATAGTPACPAGAINVSGTNEASFATNISLPANGLGTAGRALHVYYGFDLGAAATVPNLQIRLRACPTANFTAGNATACSAGGAQLFIGNTGQRGSAATTQRAIQEFTIVAGGSNTLYVSLGAFTSLGPPLAGDVTKVAFTTSSAWTLYVTVTYSAATAGNWIQQSSILPVYIN